MQSNKHLKTCNTNYQSHNPWLSKEKALVLSIIAFFYLLLCSVHIFLEFEIKQSTLVLNREGCLHLTQVGITPQPQPDTETCRLQVPFRVNLQDEGGRILLGERVIRIPEHQLVYTHPLPEQPWTSRHWMLAAWEVICILFMAGSMLLTEFCISRERE